jgi:hypothetical protein
VFPSSAPRPRPHARGPHARSPTLLIKQERESVPIVSPTPVAPRPRPPRPQPTAPSLAGSRRESVPINPTAQAQPCFSAHVADININNVYI